MDRDYVIQILNINEGRGEGILVVIKSINRKMI